MAESENIALAHELYEALSPKWSEPGHKLTADIEVNNKNLDVLKRAVELKIVSEFISPKSGHSKRAKKFDDLKPNDFSCVFTIEFIVRGGSIDFFETFDDLISTHPIERPDSFFITSDSEGVISYPSKKNSWKLQNYLAIRELWDELEKFSDDSNGAGLTFLYKGKICIPTNYDSDSLIGGLDGLTKFLTLLRDNVHEVEKGHILQNTLYSFLYHISPSEKFKYLLRNFSSFSLKFDESYQAYVVGFSFDELRRDYEERYREYMVKVNDLVSSSLMKSLAIPATIFFTSTKTQVLNTSSTAASLSEITLANFSIALSSIIVAAVLTLMMISEFKSLASIDIEYTSLMSRLQDKSPEAYKAINKFRITFKKKMSYAKGVLTSIIVFSIIYCFISILWVFSRMDIIHFPVTTVISALNFIFGFITQCMGLIIKLFF